MIPNITSSQFLEIIKSSMDEFWWGPILAENSGGAEVLNAVCELMAEISNQVSELSRQIFACYASGGKNAVVELTFTRTNTSGALTIPHGREVRTPFGLKFVTWFDVYWADGDGTAKTVMAISEKVGYDYNVTKNCITVLKSDSEFNFESLGVTVTNATAATEGRDMMLDMIAANKAIVREEAESDESLFGRFCTAEQRNTTTAIKKVIEKYSALGIMDGVMEYVPGYDAGMFLDDEYYLDAGQDPNDPYYKVFRSMLLSRNDSRRSFFVVVPPFIVEDEYAGVILDEGPTPESSAMDLFGETYGFLDAKSMRANGVVSALYAELEQKKCAGIRHGLIAKWSL